MAHVYRTAVIRSDENSQPVHNSCSASFVQACYNALNRAITIPLLVRQQLKRIDPVVTQPQRRCVRFEHPRFIGIGTEVHHQYPVWRSLFVLVSSSRAPSVAMLLLSVVACDKVTPPIPSTGAMIRRKKSVFFVRISWAMPNRRYHPLLPSHELPEFFQRSTHKAFLHSYTLLEILPIAIFMRGRDGASPGDCSLYLHFS